MRGAFCAAVVLATLLVVATPTAAHHRPLRDVAATSGITVGGSVDATAIQSDALYQDLLRSEFRSITAENEQKWVRIHPERNRYDFSGADTIANFARSNGLTMRGHTLLWHAQNPSWLGSLTRSEYEPVLRDHVRTVIARYSDVTTQWDVVNEVLEDNGDLRDTLWTRNVGDDPRDAIRIAFQEARAADPTAKLYINEYGAEGINAKSDGLYSLVSELRAEGVPIDGVGFQTHMQYNHRLGYIQSNLQRFSDLGVDVAITEFDARMPLPATASKLNTQLDIFEDAMGVCRAVARCRSFTTWGVTDNNTWVTTQYPGFGAPLAFDEAYQRKPAYFGLTQALGDRAGDARSVNAENADTKTTGAAQGGGWAFFSNGWLQHRFKLDGAPETMVVVTARGTPTAGVWPRMRISVGGTAIGERDVTSPTWAEYRVPLPSAMRDYRDVRVEFINDAFTALEDRNLYIDKVGVSSNERAEEMHIRTTGGPASGGWGLYEWGWLEQPIWVDLTDQHRIDVTAAGTFAGGAWPALRVSIDGVLAGTITVNSAAYRTYSLTVPLSAGRRTVRLEFGNDYSDALGDRNLFIDTALVRRPPDLG